MALKYTVLGAGAMGLFWGLLQELAHAQVDFVDNWQPQVDTIKQQGGVYVSGTTRDGTWFPSISILPKNTR